MSISPVSTVTSMLPGAASSLTGPAAAGSAAAASGSATAGSGTATAASGAGFPDVAGAVDSLQGLQSQADALAVRAVTGDLDDVHDYMIAASQAAVALELTAAIRNKAVDAFSEIMRMQA